MSSYMANSKYSKLLRKSTIYLVLQYVSIQVSTFKLKHVVCGCKLENITPRKDSHPLSESEAEVLLKSQCGQGSGFA